jgi:hypothetical protein
MLSEGSLHLDAIEAGVVCVAAAIFSYSTRSSSG